MQLGRAFAFLGGAALSLSFVGASCAQPMMGAMPGVLNDPKNYSLRKSILAQGTDTLCDEIRSRSQPFRFRDEDPIVGRFFPTQCQSRTLPTGQLWLTLAGQGYVWTPMSKRLGFEATVGVAYDTDFQLDGSTMYVYFRPRGATPPAFVTRMMEQSLGGMLAILVAGAAGQSLPDRYGAQIMAFQLQRGFTVIRDANGAVATDVGVLPPGQKPMGAFTSLDPDKATLANERVELHPNERDFAGPFTVPDGKKLWLTVNVEGTQAVDLLVIPRLPGDAWLGSYIHEIAPRPPPVMPAFDDAVVAGSIYRRPIALPPGQYYLVLDHTPSAGRTSIPLTGRDERVVVSYAVQVD